MRARARWSGGSTAAARRAGATLVEQVVALSVLSVGLLAIAAVGDALHRGARHAARRSEAVAVAAAWRERLVAAACAAPHAGTASDGPFHVAWSAAPAGPTASVLVSAADTAASIPPASAPASHQATGTARCLPP